MEYGADAVDVSVLTFLPDDAQKALTDSLEKMKNGKSPRRVFVASADGKTWTDRVATSDSVPSLEDLARESLEACEYWYHDPCFIVSIDGRDARDATGTWPIQPAMLTHEPSLFDASRVPFLSAADRDAVRSYATDSHQRALVLTPFGDYFWRTGDTIYDAVETAGADCKKADPEEDCILYAVDDRVVFAP